MNNYLIALLACVIAAALEGICAGNEPLQKLAQLKRPAWSPAPWAWALIGLSWYLICFVSLVRLLPAYDTSPVAVRLLGVLMVANAFANVLQFRLGRLDLAFLYLYPYWFLLGAFLLSAASLDPLITTLFSIYAAYQVYAAAWAWKLWALNGRCAPKRPAKEFKSDSSPSG